MAALCPNPLVGNDISVHIASQDACGVVNSTPAFTELLRTGGAPVRTPSYAQSSAVKTNRQARKNVKDGEELAFTLESELCKQQNGLIIAGISGASYASVNITADTISFDSSSNEIRDSDNGFTGIEPNRWLWVDGTPYYITAVASDGSAMTVSAAQPLTDAVAGSSVVIEGSGARSATTDTIYTVQKRLKDLSATGNVRYLTQTDAIIGGFSLTVPPRGIITSSFNFTTKQQIAGTAAITGQTDSSVSQVDIEPVGAVEGIENIWINFAKSNAAMNEATIEVDNALATQPQAGNAGPGAISKGTIAVTGTLNSTSLEDDPFAEVTKFEEGTRFALSIPFNFQDGSRMIVTMRRVLYTEASQNDAADEIVQTSGTYAAEEDEFGTTVQIDYMFN